MKTEERRAALQNGDPDAATELGRESVQALEAGIETAKRQLAEEGLRPESRSRWNLELRARQEELARRQAALAESESKAALVPKKNAYPAPSVANRSIYALDEGEVNNSWYLYHHEADTVFVFVHGILSNSKTCWLNEADPRHPRFWPDLIDSDPRFGKPAIFLGGFYTAIDSGLYDIRDAARELMDALRREDEHRRRPVMDFPNIVFICHSTGGIVVRYLLTRDPDEFAEKNVGLVLIASPSWGSYLANTVTLLSQLYQQKLGRQLEWGNDAVRDLDDRFRSLMADEDIPHFRGVEAFENHFVLHRKWLSFLTRTVVVEELSAARYFAEPRRLRNTNHFTAVKPDSVRHPAYELLYDFYTQKFRPMVEARG